MIKLLRKFIFGLLNLANLCSLSAGGTQSRPLPEALSTSTTSSSSSSSSQLPTGISMPGLGESSLYIPEPTEEQLRSHLNQSVKTLDKILAMPANLAQAIDDVQAITGAARAHVAPDPHAPVPAAAPLDPNAPPSNQEKIQELLNQLVRLKDSPDERKRLIAQLTNEVVASVREGARQSLTAAPQQQADDGVLDLALQQGMAAFHRKWKVDLNDATAILAISGNPKPTELNSNGQLTQEALAQRQAKIGEANQTPLGALNLQLQIALNEFGNNPEAMQNIINKLADPLRGQLESLIHSLRAEAVVFTNHVEGQLNEALENVNQRIDHSIQPVLNTFTNTASEIKTTATILTLIPVIAVGSWAAWSILHARLNRPTLIERVILNKYSVGDFLSNPEDTKELRKIIKIGQTLIKNNQPIEPILLRGEPGTGKSHAAKILAYYLGRRLYKINCNNFLSANNAVQLLIEIIKWGRKNKVCLFFDECDILAARGTNEYIVSEKGMALSMQILELLGTLAKNFEGLLIFATNSYNIDQAFVKRCKTITISLPNAASREKIIKTFAKQFFGDKAAQKMFYPDFWKAWHNQANALTLHTNNFSIRDIEFAFRDCRKTCLEAISGIDEIAQRKRILLKLDIKKMWQEQTQMIRATRIIERRRYNAKHKTPKGQTLSKGPITLTPAAAA